MSVYISQKSREKYEALCAPVTPANEPSKATKFWWIALLAPLAVPVLFGALLALWVVGAPLMLGILGFIIVGATRS